MNRTSFDSSIAAARLTGNILVCERSLPSINFIKERSGILSRKKLITSKGNLQEDSGLSDSLMASSMILLPISEYVSPEH